MIPKLIKIQYKKDYVYHLKYDDKIEGDIDFESFLWGDVFEQLKNQSLFKKAFIDDTTGTINWPNGSDIAPETLYQKVIAHTNHRATALG
jgi:hypothetical protein